MGRSNSANGGSTYVDLEIQVVSSSDYSYVLRAVAYLTSLNVSDTSNDFTIGGGTWSRSGALGVGGVYNHDPVWFQDVEIPRVTGSNVVVAVSMTWSGVNYWGTTLYAEEYFTVPARYDPPSSPGTSADQITPTSARIIVTASGYNGGANIDIYEAYLMTNNANPGAGGNVVASSGTGTFNTGNILTPSTVYYYTARAHNLAGLWSAWTPMQAFTTQAAARVKINGKWVNAIPYVKSGGVWKQAIPYVKKSGVWVQAS